MYIGRAGNGERYVVCISREVLLFPSSKQMSVCLVKHVKVGSKCDSAPVRIDGSMAGGCMRARLVLVLAGRWKDLGIECHAMPCCK